MRIRILVRKAHKWLALVIGLQVLLWTSTGLFMSFVPIETIRSEHKTKKIEPTPLNPKEPRLSIKEVLNQTKEEVLEIHLKTLLNKPVFELKHAQKTELIDAKTGEKLSPLSKEFATSIARAHYKGENKVESIKLIENPPIEYRGRVPVWQINFHNDENTSFYVSPDNGKLMAKRSTLWRIYDFMWMLHIMDYQERKNFNHWWLVLAAFLAVSMSLSGVWLIFYSFRKKDFKITRK